MSTEIDRTIELSVDGMTCGHCVMSVSEELSEIPGVKNVEVILNSGGTSKVTVLTDTPPWTTRRWATQSPRPASRWSASRATSEDFHASPTRPGHFPRPRFL